MSESIQIETPTTALRLDGATLLITWSPDTLQLPERDEDLIKIIRKFTNDTVQKFQLPQGLLEEHENKESKDSTKEEKPSDATTLIMARIESSSITFAYEYPTDCGRTVEVVKHLLEFIVAIEAHSILKSISKRNHRIDLRFSGEPNTDTKSEANVLATQLQVSPPRPLRRVYGGIETKHQAASYFASIEIEDNRAFLIVSHILSPSAYALSISTVLEQLGPHLDNEVSQKALPIIEELVSDANDFFYKT